MKTITIIQTIAIVMVLFFTQPINARTLDLRTDSTETKALTDAKILLMRLDVINATNKADLSTSKKKLLRKEARMIKGQLKEFRGGRYVPLGVIIIILCVPLTIYQVTE